MQPSSHGRSGFTTIRPRAHLSITDGGFPATVFLLSALSLGRRRPVLPVGDFLHRRACLARRHIPPVITAAGSRPSGRRPALHPPAAPIAHRSEQCSTHQSLPRNPVHRYQETPFNLTQASAAVLHHIPHVPRYGGYRATLIGSAAGMRRNTCANQRPPLPLRSYAF